MCRMFCVTGSPLLASSLQAALIDAARKDDFSNDVSHADGWGGVWFSDVEHSYVRSLAPIFSDSKALDFFASSTRPLSGLAHARYAAEGEPIRGAFDSHPFATHIAEDLVYVTHNGHINKRALQRKVGLNVDLLNDTEVFVFLLERFEGSVEERLKAAIEEVHKSEMIGALNLMVLRVTREGEKKVYYYCDYPSQEKELYYSLYQISEKRGSAVMSSTVALKAGLIDKNGAPLRSDVQKCAKQQLGLLS
jgi:predicted glutamine amidotransferase